jgi:hypothetical protein
MPPYAVQPPTSTSAILSLIFSIAGFVIVPIIGGIVGVILGNSAKKEIANSGGTVGGAGLAQAGVIIGWINIALISIPVCVIVVLALLGPVIGTTFSQINASL